MKKFENLMIPEFSLEDFMKSITYCPEGMSVSLARLLVSDESEKLSTPMRETEILKKALQILPIGINDEDLIAGNYGSSFAEKDYMDKVREANEKEFGKSPEFKVYDEDNRLISGRYMLFGIYTPAHTCVDYDTILQKGLRYYYKKAEEALPKADAYGKEYLRAMMESVFTVQAFAERYALLAEQKAHNEKSAKRKTELVRMSKALRKVPFDPANDLFEALQSMWIVHTAIPASDRSWASISLGRMDEYLLPYYEKWLADGGSRDEAEVLLANFFLLLDSYGDGSCALNLGSKSNDMTKLLLDVEKKVGYRSPIIAARFSKNSSDEHYDSFIDKTLFKIGQPTFYNEDACKEAMEYRGMSAKEDFSINSCMGMIIPGDELADMWGCCVNMNLPLELAINHGNPVHGEFPESLKCFIEQTPVEPDNMDSIREAYAGYIFGLVKYVVEQNLQRAAWVALNRPNPLLSVLTNDCIQYGRDRAHAAVHMLGQRAEKMLPKKDADIYNYNEIVSGRGAKYHNVTVLSMGFAHAADALTAIEELVFVKHKYTIEEIIAAAKENYQGSEKNMLILANLRHSKKYAESDAKANDNAAFILNALADACEKCYAGNIRYLPTCHTIDSNAQFGNCVYASLDGRCDGEAFGKNAGPVMWAVKTSPVEFILSAARLPQSRFSGGVPIDIYVMDDIFASEENRAKFRGLLKAYFELGGMQVQVNSVDVELLKKAYAEPEKYPHVIVRKGGFSLYFTDMFKNVQKDMIERFEREIQG
jgi:formate C-acetyltransferase